MEATVRVKLNDTVKQCIENNKLDKEKLLLSLHDEDFDDNIFPNDTRSIIRDCFNPECFLILINLPNVEESRLPKLQSFIFKKAFDQNPYKEPLMVHSPMDNETLLSKGIMFLRLANIEDAHAYKEKLNEFRLDKTHRIKVFTYKEYTLTQDLSEHFEFQPAVKTTPSAVSYNHWLLNDPACEQFCVVPTVNRKVEKLIMNKVETYYDEFHPIDINLNVPAKKVYWSPYGTFIALTSDGGVCNGVITGDNKFELISAYKIHDVSHIVFSPDEKFIVLCVDKLVRDNVIIADTVSSTVLWKGPVTFVPSSLKVDLFWTADSQYVIVGKSDSYKILCVADDFKSHPKNPLNVPSLKSIKVSPKTSCVAYWTTTSDSQTGIAMLYDIEKDVTHKLKQVVSPTSLDFYFQDQSNYLCIAHERVIKKKSFFNIDIVFLQEKDLPVVSLELPSLLSAFYWEPSGDVFIVCLGAQYNFYRIVDNYLKLIVSCSLEANLEALWSPNGRIVVLHSVNGTKESKEMRIFDAHTGTQLNINQFRNANKISWDSSGRYIATCATSSEFRDPGYTIWTMTGNFMRSQTVANVTDFLWRPRPPCLLSDIEIENIKKNVKQYSTQFDKVEREKSKKFNSEKRKHLASKIVNFYNTLFHYTDYIQTYNEYYNKHLQSGI